MLDLQPGEEQRHERDDQTHRQPAGHTTKGVTEQNHVRRHRRDHQLLNRPLEFCAEKTRYHVGIAVGNHRHHDQTRHYIVDIGIAAHLANAAADQIAEDHEVQRHGDTRRQQGLRPYSGKAAYFLEDDGVECNPTATPIGHGKARHGQAAPLSAFSSTSIRNSSSSRLLRLRMLSTCTFCSLSATNKALSPWCLSTCTASVCSSTSEQE